MGWGFVSTPDRLLVSLSEYRMGAGASTSSKLGDNYLPSTDMYDVRAATIRKLPSSYSVGGYHSPLWIVCLIRANRCSTQRASRFFSFGPRSTHSAAGYAETSCPSRCGVAGAPWLRRPPPAAPPLFGGRSGAFLGFRPAAHQSRRRSLLGKAGVADRKRVTCQRRSGLISAVLPAWIILCELVEVDIEHSP